MSQLNKYLDKAQDYLEAIMHDPPPIPRAQWEADKAKKKALEDQKRNKENIAYKKLQIKLSKNLERSKKRKQTSPTQMRRLAKMYISMGVDMARDHLYDDPDVDKFRDWAGSAASDMAYSLTEYMSGNEQYYFELIKNGGVQDISGWIADYIHDGMMQALKSKKKK